MGELIVSKINTVVWQVERPQVSPTIHRRALGDGFETKEEFHITLLGSAAAGLITDPEALCQAVAELAPPEEARDCELEDTLYLIDNPKTIEDRLIPRQTLVALARAAWIGAFIDRIGHRLGQQVRRPFPHLTLYTKGDGGLPWKGIGIDSRSEFDTYSKGVYAEDWQAKA